MPNTRMSRRTLLAATPAATLAAEAAGTPRRPRIAAVVTEYRKYSHAQNIVDRFLEGYGWDGAHHRPAMDVVSLYVDQLRDSDLSRERAARFPGMRLYPTIAGALTQGGDQLAVDGVLLIGEHGEYPRNDRGQTLYPRYEFFRAITDVFRRSGRTAPVFNDKHLSWKWEWAKEMADTAQQLGFGFMAGSSLPVTWRIPSLDLPWGAEVVEAFALGPGGPDSYDFHALEAAQCLLERRRGGETGVRHIQARRGPAAWQALEAPSWAAGGCDPELLQACLCRSFMLKPLREGFSHALPDEKQLRDLEKNPVLYRYEHRDGVRVTMMLAEALVQDITVAVRVRGEAAPFSLQMYLGAGHQMQPNFFNPLVRHVETLFETGASPIPIGRTLLTTGLVAAGIESLARGEVRVETPHLDIRYRAPRRSLFRQS